MNPRNESSMPDNRLTDEALPFHPSNVDSNDIKSNGMLLSDEEIVRIQASAQVTASGSEFTRISKKQLKSDFSVIKSGESLYAIYKGGQQGLGAGKMGAVKLAQNLQTGQWVALKVQEVEGEKLEELQSEYQRLQKAGFALGESAPIRSKSKARNQGEGNRETYQILMQYIPGVTLDSIVTKNLPMNPEKRLQVGKNAVAAFNELNKNGIVHGDIHGGNILINRNTLQATPIDFGLSSLIGDKSPDEAKRALRNEAFKIANMLVHLYGFALAKKDGAFVVIENEGSMASKWIPDAETRQKLAIIISNIYKENPNLDQAIQDLSELKTNYSYLPQQALKIAIVDVNEFNPNNNEFLDTLKLFDQVVLIDNDIKKDAKFYSSIRNTIDAQGVAVHDRLLRGDDIAAVVDKLPMHLDRDNDSASAYFMVTQKTLKGTNPQVAHINPSQDVRAVMIDHVNNTIVSPQDKAKIQEILNQEIGRLAGGIMTNKGKIQEAKDFLLDMNNNDITYNLLAEKLQSLEKKLGQSGLMKHMFNVLDKKTPSQLVVSKIRDAILIKATISLNKSRGPIPKATVPKPQKVQSAAAPVKREIINDNNAQDVTTAADRPRRRF